MQRATGDYSTLRSLTGRDDPAIQNSRKLPFLASKRTASEHFCNYCLETSAYAVYKILLREAEI